MIRISILFLILFPFFSEAQIKPTPIEFLFGNNRIQGQTIIIKSLPKSKFGIFSLTTLAGDYKNNDKSLNEVVSTIQLNYDIYKGIKLAGGANFNSSKGFSPVVGLQYQYTKDWMLVVNPTFELNKQVSFKTFALLEYAKKNTEKISPYLRLQGMYVQNLSTDKHERSFAVARAGIFFKGFATGIGVNQDYYGSLKTSKTNFGLFLHYKFI